MSERIYAALFFLILMASGFFPWLFFIALLMAGAHSSKASYDPFPRS